MDRIRPELKRVLAGAVGAGMALLAVSAVVDGALRLRDAQGLVGSLLRQPVLHARAALALTGIVSPPDEPSIELLDADAQDAFALVDPELSVRRALQIELEEDHGGCPNRRRALPASSRVRTQGFELTLSPGAPRWLQRALQPLLADGA